MLLTGADSQDQDIIEGSDVFNGHLPLICHLKITSIVIDSRPFLLSTVDLCRLNRCLLNLPGWWEAALRLRFQKRLSEKIIVRRI